MSVSSLLKNVYRLLLSQKKRELLQAHYQRVRKILSAKKVWLLSPLSSNGSTPFALKKHNNQYSLKLSFSRKLSRIAGRFAHIRIPHRLRKPFYSLYSKIYGVKLEEIEHRIDSFESFSKFFTRTIKPRPIDLHPLSLASPADSTVLTFSEVRGDEVLIVKGIEYKLGEFLTGISSYQIREEQLTSMKRNQQNKLYQIILYLAPGDYHRFHAPADCSFKTRNHIVGKLLPVKEKYVKTHTGVYEKNERVNLFGEWVKGLMCMVFVGALNVGSIDLNFDPSLKTNKKLKLPFTNTNVRVYTEEETTQDDSKILANSGEASSFKKCSPKGIQVKKGQEIGKFNLGSTIVLVFEASADFEWKIMPGETVKYGQCIGISR